MEVSEEITRHPLFRHYVRAIEQALYGKGTRHGGATIPFMEQPIFHYAKLHGRGFLTGQAAKKLEEAASTRTGEAFLTEMYGAMVYMAAACIFDTIEEPKKIEHTLTEKDNGPHEPSVQQRS